MRFERRTKSWALASAFGFAAALIGCNEAQEGAPSSPAGVAPDAPAYTTESIKLKDVPGVDYDRQLRQLQSKYSITPLNPAQLPPNPVDPKVAAVKLLKRPDDMSAVKTPLALGKTATVFASGNMTMQPVFMEIIYLHAGDQIQRYTSGGSPGVDPVEVLWRFTNQTHDFKATGTIDDYVSHLDEVYAFSDDVNGNHPSFTFTSNDDGWYAFMVFAYAASSQGTVTLTQMYKPVGGSFAGSTQTISVTGTTYRYYEAQHIPGYVSTTSTGGTRPDTWAFFWDFSSNRGGDNDDAPGRGLASYINTGAWYPNTATAWHNCILITGYPDWNPGNGGNGTASWQYNN